MVYTDPLANLLKLFSNDISCVFLNSCYSKHQAVAIRKFIPHVRGMNGEVSDEIAIKFATLFYQAIGAGKSIQFAFEFATISIKLYYKDDIDGIDDIN